MSGSKKHGHSLSAGVLTALQNVAAAARAGFACVVANDKIEAHKISTTQFILTLHGGTSSASVLTALQNAAQAACAVLAGTGADDKVLALAFPESFPLTRPRFIVDVQTALQNAAAAARAALRAQASTTRAMPLASSS